MPRLVLLSDTHNQLHNVVVPDGDIAVHSGDWTKQGSRTEVENFAESFGALPHAFRVCCAGNHDFYAEEHPHETREIMRKHNIIWLENEGAEVLGLKFWGIASTPWFHDFAYNCDEEELFEIFSRIPVGTDVLVTHGPPQGICDRTARGNLNVGSPSQLEHIKRSGVRLANFGHIHEGYGKVVTPECTYVNSSICTLQYKPTNLPFVVDLEPRIVS